MVRTNFLVVCLLAAISLINAGIYVGEYYVSYPQKVNWFAANRFCTYYGMHLIDVPHQKEYTRVLGIIDSLKNTTAIANESIWTSGTRLWEENSYYWETTGQPIVFADWYPSDPNYGTEKCVFLYHPGGHNFADVICTASCVFMCRKTSINPLHDLTCARETY